MLLNYSDFHKMSDYELIDSGSAQKLERFGPFVLIRPCAQALWKPALAQSEWEKASATFKRLPKAQWSHNLDIPTNWNIEHKNLTFSIERTDFGHIGLFPEHSLLWDWIGGQIEGEESFSLLNLFGYSGATSLFAAKCGAKVCHLDASKKIVEKAKENAALNEMQDYPIRWIVDDALKFLKREQRRENSYDGIILDPPSFGRGAKGEVFKFEDDLAQLLELVSSVLSTNAKFVLMTCHTLGVTPAILKNVLSQVFPKSQIEVGELALKSKHHDLPKGIYAKCVFR